MTIQGHAKSIRDAVEATLVTALDDDTITALQAAITTALIETNGDLQTIAGGLADIHAELIDKFEAGQLVGMSQATLDGIGDAVATLFHYPTDYPSAGANTKLDTLHTDLTSVATSANQTSELTKLDTLHSDLAALGTDTGTPPSSGTGVRGWLRGIYDKVAALPTTTPQTNALTDTQLRASAVPISASALPLPAGAALDSSVTALHTDLGHLTDNTQTTKITDGTTTASVVSVATGWNAQSVIPAVLKTSYSTIVADTTAIDALGYTSVAISVTTNAGTWSLQGSIDNVNFSTIPIGTPNNTGPTIVSTGNTMGTGLFQAYTGGYRYIRLHRTSGTLTGDMTLYVARPFEIGYSQTNTVLQVGQSGTWNVTAYATTTATTSINAATSATTGSTYSPTGGVGSASLQVIVGGTGSWSALTVVLEGSLDGSNWWTLATYNATVSGGVSASNMPALRLRARTTTATAASGTPTVTAIVVGTI